MKIKQLNAAPKYTEELLNVFNITEHELRCWRVRKWDTLENQNVLQDTSAPFRALHHILTIKQLFKEKVLFVLRKTL